ncbi:hypothetical protein IJ135_00085 [Candidatus Saccharibacteria bacterium]|nr:hypothetical protein [Candidatus Saccharibacteria bacterium]
MQKAQKNLLGFSGLALVTAMTAVAITIPTPGASAITTSVEDQITVHVQSAVAAVSISSSLPSSVTDSDYSFTVDYDSATTVTVSATYKKGGNTYTKVIDTFNPNPSYGSKPYTVNLDTIDFGGGVTGSYGQYTITVEVIGTDGTPISDYLSFKYVPVRGSIINAGGKPTAVIDGLGDDAETVVIYDGDGNELGRATKAELEANGMQIPLNLDQVGCQTNVYVYAYDAHGNQLGEPTLLTMDCPEIPGTSAPDTGGLFQNLNISREDYLITGLLVFLVVGIIGFGVVARSRRNATASRNAVSRSAASRNTSSRVATSSKNSRSSKKRR